MPIGHGGTSTEHENGTIAKAPRSNQSQHKMRARGARLTFLQ